MNTHTPSQGDPGADSNPYMNQQQEAPSQAGLDAGAPVLPTADNQRLNRKALLFLAGLVLLLVAAGWLLLRSADDNTEEPAPVARTEQVEVPAAPVAPPLPPADPIPLADAAATQPLPPMPEPPPELYAIDSRVPPGPTLAERRMMAEVSANTGPANPNGQPQPQQAGLLQPTQASSATFLDQPNVLLLRGTYIRCALETRLITDVDGYTSCVVTEPVYSVNGSRLLLPKGSKVFGEYGSNGIRGQRMAVIWDRIVTPTGIDVTMASPGVDQLGSAGHPGDYSAHWGERIGSALFISLLSDAFKYYGEKEGPNTVTAYPGAGAVVQSPYQSNTARTLQNLANQAVQTSANRAPTITINQGTILNIYVAKDVDFSGVLRN